MAAMMQLRSFNDASVRAADAVDDAVQFLMHSAQSFGREVVLAELSVDERVAAGGASRGETEDEFDGSDLGVVDDPSRRGEVAPRPM